MLTAQSGFPVPKGASSPWAHPAHTQGPGAGLYPRLLQHPRCSPRGWHSSSQRCSGLPEMLAKRAPSILRPLGLGLSRGLEMNRGLCSFWLLMSPVCVAQSRSSFTFQPLFPRGLQEDTQRVRAIAVLLLASRPPEGLPGLPAAHHTL